MLSFLPSKENQNMAQSGINKDRMSFWLGNVHRTLIERACETLETNKSELARRLIMLLDTPKENIRKMFGNEIDEFEHSPK
jgi:hypothetical protein